MPESAISTCHYLRKRSRELNNVEFWRSLKSSLTRESAQRSVFMTGLSIGGEHILLVCDLFTDDCDEKGQKEKPRASIPAFKKGSRYIRINFIVLHHHLSQLLLSRTQACYFHVGFQRVPRHVRGLEVPMTLSWVSKNEKDLILWSFVEIAQLFSRVQKIKSVPTELTCKSPYWMVVGLQRKDQRALRQS